MRKLLDNGRFTYLYLSGKRSHAGMDAGDALPRFHGVGVHDCWKSYWKYDITHGICCAHLLRECDLRMVKVKTKVSG